jgi:hypothetical protein
MQFPQNNSKGKVMLEIFSDTTSCIAKFLVYSWGYYGQQREVPGDAWMYTESAWNVGSQKLDTYASDHYTLFSILQTVVPECSPPLYSFELTFYNFCLFRCIDWTKVCPFMDKCRLKQFWIMCCRVASTNVSNNYINAGIRVELL